MSRFCLQTGKTWEFGWKTVVPAHVSPQSFVELIEAAGGVVVRAGVTGEYNG